jgi:hypothetical protein
MPLNGSSSGISLQPRLCYVGARSLSKGTTAPVSSEQFLLDLAAALAGILTATPVSRKSRRRYIMLARANVPSGAYPGDFS